MKTDVTDFQAVLFGLGEDVYALPIADVREVRPFEPPASLPESLTFVAGVVRVRGVFLTVIDLAARLGKEKSKGGPKARILIVRLSNSWMGLIVDEVPGVVTFPKERLQAPPPGSQSLTQPPYTSAIFFWEGRSVLLLDIAVLLSEQERQKIERTNPHA